MWVAMNKSMKIKGDNKMKNKKDMQTPKHKIVAHIAKFLIEFKNTDIHTGQYSTRDLENYAVLRAQDLYDDIYDMS